MILVYFYLTRIASTKCLRFISIFCGNVPDLSMSVVMKAGQTLAILGAFHCRMSLFF